MSRHTPAPWLVKNAKGKFLGDKTDWHAVIQDRRPKGGCSTYIPIQKGRTRTTIALVVGEGWNDTEIEANAHMLSASLEMYDALKWCMDTLASMGVGYVPGDIALAKAEGKSHGIQPE